MPRSYRSFARRATLAVLSVILPFAMVSYAGAAEPVNDQVSAPLLTEDDARVAPSEGRSFGPMAAVTAPTGDYRIDALLSGWALPGTTVTYSFYEDSVFAGDYYGPQTGVREVSEPVKANVRDIMDWYESIMNVDFVEVTETASTVGYIRFMLSDMGSSYAYAYYPSGTSMFSLVGDVHLNPTYDNALTTNGFASLPGKHGYMSLAHEIGHTFGLKHPFDPESGYSTILPDAEDNTSNTIMTYTFLGDSPGTPMAYDLAALHHMYGAKTKNATASTYRFTSRGTSQYTVGGTTWQDTTSQTKQSIWDSDGIDTIDATNLPAATSGYLLDLRPGGWLVGYEQHNTTWFTYGSSLGLTTTVEELINSRSNDTIYANDAANRFGGYTAGRSVGNDVIIGATAADTLDLPAYSEGSVTQMRVGNDHKITLTAALGSVTLRNYYTAGRPAIVFAENRPPVAGFSTSRTSGRTPCPVRFTSTSTDPDGAVAACEWDFGDGQTGTGTIVDHSFVGAGVYTVTLTATDAQGASDTASTTITVAPNQAPVALDDTGETLEDEALTVAAPGLLANDSDGDGDPLTPIIETDPAHGDVVVGADGGFTYTPEPNFSGVDTFTYRASDGFAASPVRSVTITVTAVLDDSEIVLSTTNQTLSAYGAAFTLKGTVFSDGNPAGRARVVLQRASGVGKPYSDTSVAATTTASGAFALAHVPSSTSVYRARVVASDSVGESFSTGVLATPRTYVGTPGAPTTMSRSKYYTVRGSLKPRHTSGTYPVRIYKWKKTSSGGWKSYGYTKAKISNYDSYSRYAKSLRLSSSGTWRLRAYTPADAGHAGTWSSTYDYVKVK